MDVVDKLALKLWNYHHLNHEVKPADIIMCFTSIDLSVPIYVAELFKNKMAPLILISGKRAVNNEIKGNIQQTNWGTSSEAEKYAQLMKEEGVPGSVILIEEKATNSGENVIYSYELLKKRNMLPRKVIIVHKPTMERRAYATFKNFWPDPTTEVMVTSKPIEYQDYVGKVVDRDLIINIMVGDLQRIIIYPAQGYQIPQDVPQDVMESYKNLCKLGYTKHLISQR